MRTVVPTRRVDCALYEIDPRTGATIKIFYADALTPFSRRWSVLARARFGRCAQRSLRYMLCSLSAGTQQATCWVADLQFDGGDVLRKLIGTDWSNLPMRA